MGHVHIQVSFSSKMTRNLMQFLQNMISATGPISIAEYMHLCHSHPEFGYYTTNNPIGKTGDFVTAPEISQIFGELLASWGLGAWQAIGKPATIHLVELGPGRGTLMNDILRVARAMPEFHNTLNVAMVETSTSLRSTQLNALEGFAVPIQWYDTIDDLPQHPALFIANEFLDAIPFRQYTKSQGKWHEVFVDIDDENKLTLVAGGTGIDNHLLPTGHENEPDGAVFEIAPAREAIVATIANHIKKNDGAALFIDYGHAKSGFGDTFQAVRSHMKTNPLTDPGNCDLTSHVDFDVLSDIAQNTGVHAFPVINQGDFLLELGLLERAGALGHGKTTEQQQQIKQDVERLAADDQMGKLFKAFCITNSKQDIPPFRN